MKYRVILQNRLYYIQYRKWGIWWYLKYKEFVEYWDCDGGYHRWYKTTYDNSSDAIDKCNKLISERNTKKSENTCKIVWKS